VDDIHTATYAIYLKSMIDWGGWVNA